MSLSGSPRPHRAYTRWPILKPKGSGGVRPLSPPTHTQQKLLGSQQREEQRDGKNVQRMRRNEASPVKFKA